SGSPALALGAGPNPAPGTSTLRFSLPAAGRVELTVYDIAGRRVARLAHGVFTAGEHAIPWDRVDEHGRRVGAGVYLARLEATGGMLTTHVVLVN
ncbi:MAG: FlgD immunoglobulin-like domain containing protein, partial [Candidatus Eisenbacteria bacterium]